MATPQRAESKNRVCFYSLQCADPENKFCFCVPHCAEPENKLRFWTLHAAKSQKQVLFLDSAHCGTKKTSLDFALCSVQDAKNDA